MFEAGSHRSEFSAPEKEREAVGQWIAERIKGGCEPHEIGVIVRSDRELKRARAAVKIAAARGSDLDEGPSRSAAASPSARCTSRRGWSSSAWP